MGRKTDDQIDILRRLADERDELEQQLAEQTDELKQLTFNKKTKSESAIKIVELKSKITNTRKKLKHARNQVAFFAEQIGGKKNAGPGQLIALSLLMFVLGALIGNYLLPLIQLPGTKGPVDQLTICEFVYNEKPAGLGPDFEIAKDNVLHCFAELSSRSNRSDYFIEWYYKKELKDATPLPVSPKSTKAWCQRKFSLEEIGEWEAHLKTRDGNTYAISSFKIIYPKIEIPVAMICEDVVNEQAIKPANIFLAKSRTLFCFTEARSKEKYTEIIHEWFLDNQLKKSEIFQLDQLAAKKSSSLNITKKDTGSWFVNILDGKRNVLKRVRFSVQPKKIEVERIDFCAMLKDNQPDSALNRIVADGKQYYFSSVVRSNFPGIAVKHQWRFNKKIVSQKEFNSDSVVARFNSTRTIRSKQYGVWELRITDLNGNVISSKQITASKPITEDVSINRLVFCRTVFQRDPYDIASQFKITDPIKIWAHASVNNKRSRTSITYKWFYNGKLIKQNEIKNIVPSKSYRTYDYKTIYPQQSGTWKVNIYAEDGTLLKGGRFVIKNGG